MYLNDSSAIITPVITVHYVPMGNNTIPHPVASTASHLSLPFASCTNNSPCICHLCAWTPQGSSEDERVWAGGHLGDLGLTRRHRLPSVWSLFMKPANLILKQK